MGGGERDHCMIEQRGGRERLSDKLRCSKEGQSGGKNG